MPQARFLAEGDSIDYTPSVAVAVGDVIVAGELVAVAHRAIADGELGSLRIEGVHEVAKIAATAITLGAIIYWDDAANVATPTAGSLKRMGVCVKAALAADTVVHVALGR